MARKRANGEGTIYKKQTVKNGIVYTSWEAQTTINGRRRSFSGKTQAEVLEKLQNAKNEYSQTGKLVEPSKLTLSAWLDEWLVIKKPTVKYNTYKQYRSNIENHIKPELGNTKLKDLNQTNVQLFISSLSRQDPVTGEPKVSAKTVKNIHGILKGSLGMAVKHKLIRENPAIDIELPRIEKKEMIVLTKEEFLRFREAIKGDEYEKLFLLIAYTGMRHGEALGLTWDCIDIENGIIEINGQLDQTEAGEWTVVETKTEKKRKACVGEDGIEILKRIDSEQRKNRLKSGSLWQGWKDINERGKAFIFTHETGEHFSERTVLKHFKAALQKADLPEEKLDMRVHDLRHTNASFCLQNGLSIKYVQKALGHSEASFTLNTYGHITEEVQREAAKKMNDFLAVPKVAAAG